MKKIFSLAFTLVFVNQVSAMQSEGVATDVAVSDETIRSVATQADKTESTSVADANVAEARAVYEELKTRGLTDAEIVTTVEEKLCGETTVDTLRAFWSKNKKYIIWGLVGVLATVGVYFGAKCAYGKLKSEKKGTDNPAASEVVSKDSSSEVVVNKDSSPKGVGSSRYNFRPRHTNVVSKKK